MNDLVNNINKIHTTSIGNDRIKKNLKINIDVTEYCKNKILDKNSIIYVKGKNYYCTTKDEIITINKYSFTIITAHKIKRCSWCNLNNYNYLKYHDIEWGILNLDDKYLYEMLILESFQAGLSWECILNKRESFRKSYDNFNIEKVVLYDEEKITELLNNKNIIRNKLKIKASINNSIIFKKIQSEYGSFNNYLKTFTNNKIIYEVGKTTNKLSDDISNDLIKRGMKFVGSTIIYSYLQAIGIINSHDKSCFLHN